jgi:hypothetical protein
VHQLVETKRFNACLQHDQLIVQRKAGSSFIGFSEAPIHFAPTFKLKVAQSDPNSGMFRQTSSVNRQPKGGLKNSTSSVQSPLQISPIPAHMQSLTWPSVSSQGSGLGIGNIPQVPSSMDAFLSYPSEITSDKRVYNNQRTPSWTDRILFKSRPPRKELNEECPGAPPICCQAYTSISKQPGSDHLPVVGVFDVPFHWNAIEHIEQTPLQASNSFQKGKSTIVRSRTKSLFQRGGAHNKVFPQKATSLLRSRSKGKGDPPNAYSPTSPGGENKLDELSAARSSSPTLSSPLLQSLTESTAPKNVSVALHQSRNKANVMRTISLGRKRTESNDSHKQPFPPPIYTLNAAGGNTSEAYDSNGAVAANKKSDGDRCLIM